MQGNANRGWDMAKDGDNRIPTIGLDLKITKISGDGADVYAFFGSQSPGFLQTDLG